ncbi:MAG: beta-ketoacyl-[acyl-carrier-protein] synthase family protein [Deltaproteobacteria bacterium]|nr:MAG: beta-ketoacyl-[acyl-carrier-protein] synthase family protein [Deltaproteobacteria bacterium]
MTACLVAAELLTPYGEGIDACWQGLLAGRSAIAPVTRFAAQAFVSRQAATLGNLSYHGGESLVMQMLTPLLKRLAPQVPADSRLLLATTKGEIDLLEQALLTGSGDPAASVPARLLAKVAALSGCHDPGTLVSAACTSGSAALARAAALIRAGRADSVLVVAADAVTEFVCSGFSALMALDPAPARPFDRHRAGLTVGEAAAAVLVMSADRARREGRPILGTLAGWGLSDDANHMTGPSRDSAGLIRAIGAALAVAGVDAEAVGLVGAHGTGTRYNDEMEMRAFRSVFAAPVPVHSIKGAVGHTMGAAGLVETLMALEALRAGVAPPTVNLVEADDDAAGWVAARPRPVSARAALVTNAGFGGINSALVLRGGPGGAA